MLISKVLSKYNCSFDIFAFLKQTIQQPELQCVIFLYTDLQKKEN